MCVIQNAIFRVAQQQKLRKNKNDFVISQMKNNFAYS